MSHSPRRFPILDGEVLMSLPKAQKQQDIDRMVTSPNSEDWVTWNLMRALARVPGREWWPGVVAAAEADTGGTPRRSKLSDPPTVELWRTVPSPREYEAASRRRMAESVNADLRKRAWIPTDVEGETEVDLVFDGSDYLVFVEAKLHSDAPSSTTYDPERNQIIRNIDCVIEEAGDREPLFWMIVRDRSSDRLYMQLVERYREHPSELHRLLPHRDPALLTTVAASIAVLTWHELIPLIPDSDELETTRSELQRRAGHSPNIGRTANWDGTPT